jgi:tRNA pseudouridine55 synthase
VGHTGTLDPLASGVLPLVIGRATRLAGYLNGEKEYEALIRLGIDTDTYDLHGRPVGAPADGPWPAAQEVDRALEPFRGVVMQRPPAFSAKKIDGQRSYEIARRASAGGLDDDRRPQPSCVEAFAIDLLDVTDAIVRLRIRCSAGFYVRSLAHDLGTALGLGAHLIGLRRTAAGGWPLDRAISLETVERDPEIAEQAIVPMARMFPETPTVALNASGVDQVRFGRDLRPQDVSEGLQTALDGIKRNQQPVCVLDPGGRLVAIAVAARTPGLLHPSVVLM